jgi:hypothetical protein
MSYLQNPDLWGPPTWYLIHVVAYNFRPKYKELYKNLFQLLGNYIPCQKCRGHYNRYRRDNKIDWDNIDRDGFIDWTHKFHNAVSKRLGKPQWSIEKLNQKYRNKWNKKNFLAVWLIFAQWILMHNKNTKPFKRMVLATLATHPNEEKAQKLINRANKFNKWSSRIEVNKFVSKLYKNM